jgi:GntR family transcriptional regulator
MAVLSKAKVTTATEVVGEQLRKAILTGAFEPGSQLPPEKELVAMLGVSRATLREALRMLEEQGLIVRRHGVGTFVRARPILKNLSLNYGITDMISSAGRTASTAYIDIREEKAGSETAEKLRIDPDSSVFVIERIRTADDQPVVYSLDIFPSTLIGDKEELDSLGSRSIYEYFQTELGLSIHHGIASLSPVPANKELARHLKLRAGAPLLFMLQVDYLDEDQPILLSLEYHIPDAFEFTVYRNGPGGIV